MQYHKKLETLMMGTPPLARGNPTHTTTCVPTCVGVSDTVPSKQRNARSDFPQEHYIPQPCGQLTRHLALAVYDVSTEFVMWRCYGYQMLNVVMIDNKIQTIAKLLHYYNLSHSAIYLT